MGQGDHHDAHMGLLEGSKEKDKPLPDNEQREERFEGYHLHNVFYITSLAGWQHGASVSSYRTAHGKNWRLQRLPSPSPRPPPRPHQHWIAGSIARGVLPVITGNRFIRGVQLCPQIYDCNRAIYTANKRANGSQDLFSCVSVCFPDAFFLLSLLGSWSFGICWGFSASS